MNTHKEPLSNCCGAKPCGELAYDNSGRCGDCKEGCMFEVEPTPPSQIEERTYAEGLLDGIEQGFNEAIDMILPTIETLKGKGTQIKNDTLKAIRDNTK